MNRTLTELARANLNNHEIPEYLWEYAISHVAYVRNHAYMKRMGTLTPFQGWFNHQPNVAHLREFGAPVWILLQGQKEQHKMLPKYKRRICVGYNDGSKSVKYYNAETRKVLTSRNFKSLNLSIDRKSLVSYPAVLGFYLRIEGASIFVICTFPRTEFFSCAQSLP